MQEDKNESFKTAPKQALWRGAKGDDAFNYIREVKRLLVSGGWHFSSWFLMDDFALTNIKRGLSKYTFSHETAPHPSDELRDKPGKVTAIDLWQTVEEYSRNSLKSKMLRGAWSFQTGVNKGLAKFDEFPIFRHSQDVIVASTESK